MASLNEVLQDIISGRQAALSTPRFVMNSTTARISPQEMIQQKRVEAAAPAASSTHQSSLENRIGQGNASLGSGSATQGKTNLGSSSVMQSSTAPPRALPAYVKPVDLSDSFNTLLTALRQALLQDDTARSEAVSSQGIARADTQAAWDKIGDFAGKAAGILKEKEENANQNIARIPDISEPYYDTVEGLGALFGQDDTDRSAAIRNEGLAIPDAKEPWDKISAFSTGVGNGLTAKAGIAAQTAQTSSAVNQKYREMYSDVAEEDIPGYIEGLLELGSRGDLDYAQQVQMKYGMRWLYNLGLDKGNIRPTDPHMADPQHRLETVSDEDRETSHAALAAYEVLASQYSKPFALLTGALSFVPGVEGGYNRAYESGELFSDLADSEQYGDIYDLANSQSTIETAKEESPVAYRTGAALSGLAQAAIPLGEAKVMEWLGKAVSPIITKAGLKLPTYAEFINNLLQKGRTIVTNAEKNQGKKVLDGIGGKIGTEGAGKTAVIGETMKRVQDYAKTIDAEVYGTFKYYDKTKAMFGEKLANFIGGVDNALWLIDKMVQKYKIIDLGLDVERATRSPYYLMESVLSYLYKHKDYAEDFMKGAF